MFIKEQMLIRLRLLPLICLVSAHTPGYTEFFNDFPEARSLVAPTGRTFGGTLWQTARGNLARVSLSVLSNPHLLILFECLCYRWPRLAVTPLALQCLLWTGRLSSPSTS